MLDIKYYKAVGKNATKHQKEKNYLQIKSMLLLESL